MHFPIDFDGVEDHSLAAQPELRADLGSGASNLVGTDSARASLFDRRADWILELEERLDNTTENFASSIEKIANSVASSVYDADEMQEALRDLALPSAWDEVFESLKNYAEELRIKVSFAIDVETFIVLDSDEFTVDGSLTLSLASSKLVRAGVGAKFRIHHIDDHTWATLPPRRNSNIEGHNGDPHKSNDVDFSSTCMNSFESYSCHCRLPAQEHANYLLPLRSNNYSKAGFPTKPRYSPEKT